VKAHSCNQTVLSGLVVALNQTTIREFDRDHIMKVFWNPDCLLHDPPYEILSREKVPYSESPARLQLIKKELERHPSLFTFELASSSESSESQDLKLDVSRYVQMVHGHDYLRYLSNAYDNWVRSGGSTVPLPLSSLVISYLTSRSRFSSGWCAT